MNKLIPITDPNEIKQHLNSSQIISNSYQLYQGSSGFQDYGVIGHKIKQNITNIWRQVFLTMGNIHEVETPLITPYSVLKASGHVDNFTDYVIYDKEGKCHRADHLVKNHPLFKGNVDEMKPSELETYIKDNQLIDIKEDASVVAKNLMLEVDSTSENRTFLRPEIAQGMFVNMKQYLDHFGGKLPFGIAQVGRSFRREISPQPFVRLREFTQAEIEYVFDPLNGTHQLFNEVEDLVIPLLSSENQSIKISELNRIRVGDAVEKGIICNQIMGYFIGKIHCFAETLGLDLSKIRFRQHLQNEMAHYAVQCWDLECQIGNNWLECVGCAHRGSHDLKAHNVSDVFSLKRNNYSVISEKSINIKEIKKNSNLNFQTIMQDVNNKVDIDEIITKYNLSPADIVVKTNKIYETFIPNVIEPSVGIDRMCYALLAHNLYKRTDELKESSNRLVLKLNKQISPYNVAIFQLSNKPELNQIVTTITKDLTKHGFKCYTDFSSTSIGKKYVRVDEIGVTCCITIDFETLNDETMAIRFRDNMTQIRIKKQDLVLYLRSNDL